MKEKMMLVLIIIIITKNYQALTVHIDTLYLDLDISRYIYLNLDIMLLYIDTSYLYLVYTIYISIIDIYLYINTLFM